ncbi:hypothetical protein GTQ40_02170 [Flavobacteriaceae bacterium R38]|nr:hypothetical protein [Flavobacteriaceae bacterium R38]
MKTIANSFFKFFILINILVLISCSSDNDNDDIENSSDLNITIDENPAQGQFLGIVSSQLSGNSTFAITSQTPEEAFTIDNATGEISVNNPNLFDYENNPVLEATIAVNNEITEDSIEVKVSLNNIDDIAHFLNVSRSDYLKTPAGQWVKITENEYNILAESLNHVTKSGASDLDYDNETILTEPSANNISIANNNGQVMPKESYVFAFKYFAYDDDTEGVRLLQSTTSSISHFYTALSAIIPAHGSGDNYFVLKGNNFRINGDIGHTGLYSLNRIGFKRIPNRNYNITPNEDFGVLRVPRSDGVYIYQGLSTTQIQWD